MGFADFYFERQRDFKIKIIDQPKTDLSYIIVIPCYNEFNILTTLNSLWECTRPTKPSEVYIVINSSEDASQEVKEQNTRTHTEVLNWNETRSDPLLRFFVLFETGLPKKSSGAGLARKIGMDHAVQRFNLLNKKDGIIISLDADTIVKPNYLSEIEGCFNKYPKTNATTIYFEHPIKGPEFSDETYKAIGIYELYLRYYKLAVFFTGFPYSYYTIGSCFAVNAMSYVKQGGMNKKQAGEDFYFLHKIFPLGNIKEINTTCVYPSPRPSDRVPFGTGPMVDSIVKAGKEAFLTYNFKAFIELKTLFSQVGELYRISEDNLEVFLKKMPWYISEFLMMNNVSESIYEINKNSSTINTFMKRFYAWFNAFRIVKFLNFAHEGYYEKQELLNEAEKLLMALKYENKIEKSYEIYLETFRKLEKQF